MTTESSDRDRDTAAPLAPGEERGQRRSSGMATTVLQLLMALLVIQIYQIEQRRQLLTILALAFAAAAVLPRLSTQFRPLLLSGVTCLALVLALETQAVVVFGVAGLLIGICYLPLAFRLKVVLLLVVTGVLCWQRAGDGQLFWIIAGSMFMFRLLIFLQETRRLPTLPPLTDTLPYFFMLPNVCFPLFPVVDFRTWQQSLETSLSADRLRSGANWIVLGTLHLLIYRAIRYWFLIPPQEISSVGELLQFLTANYGLYLHVSGHFHISIGVLHLFGYRLPKTHDWFFLASSFTDIWRRINIYWKDFMSGLFFMPTFFRLRTVTGDRLAICAAVGVAFVATWLAHSWQTFWLLGRFPVTWQDATLWLTAGVAVGANALLDYRQARRKRPAHGAAFSVPGAIGHTLRVLAVFLCVSLFWAQWTNPGVILGLITSAGATGFVEDASLPLWAMALFLVIAVGVVLQYAAKELRRTGFADSSLAQQMRLAGNVGLMSVLLVAALPAMRSWLPNDPARVLATLRLDRFTQSESSRMVQGYYEELNEGSLQTAVFGPEDPGSVAERSQQQQNFLDFTRRRNDALELELIPDYEGRYAGKTITINSWGMRNPDIERAKRAGTWRIAVVGSSVVMGYGVGNDEPFCRLLEARFNSAESGIQPVLRTEVLNFGVGTYSVLHQLVQLEEKVLDFEPDALLYLCHQAELAGPGIDLARMHAAGLIDDPELLKIIREAGATDETAAGPLRQLLLTSGPSIVDHCYRQIVARCREQDVVPIWGYLTMPGDFPVSLEQSEVEPIARAAGFCTMDLQGWDAGFTPAEIMLSDGDPHANDAGHRLIAESILRQLPTCSELPGGVPQSGGTDR